MVVGRDVGGGLKSSQPSPETKTQVKHTSTQERCNKENSFVSEEVNS